MTAYTGATVRRWYGAAVFDLDGMEAPDRLAILLEHRGSEIVGHADKISISAAGGVKLAGSVYSDEEAGERVRRLSRKGFPWKASIGVDVSRWQELDQGETATVNGRDVAGPISIARESRLFETSFVVNPADKGTDAEAMSEEPPMTEPKTKAKPAETKPADPEALSAAKADGAKSSRDELGAFLDAFPGREGWAARRFAEGKSTIEAKADLADVLAAELAEAKKAAALTVHKGGVPAAELAEGDGSTVEELDQAGAPGVGFSATDRQAGSSASRENLSALSFDDRVERLWNVGAIQAEFGTRGALVAIARREGLDALESEVAKA